MNPIYEKIESLCAQRGINLTQLCQHIGISRGILTDLKMGRKQNLSLPTLQKLSAYFQVPLDHFSPSSWEESADAFTYALYQETHNLTEENKRKLLELARFFQEQQKKEAQNR